jgi:aflatoxin B1 aldehyde reductase
VPITHIGKLHAHFEYSIVDLSSPLAGGFLTGKVTLAKLESNNKSLERTRWTGESTMAYYPNTFDKPEMHEAILNLKEKCDAASPSLSLQEAAMRWIIHHSALKGGDAVIFGAKRIEQLKANVADARRGPLPADIQEEMEGMWKRVLAARNASGKL